MTDKQKVQEVYPDAYCMKSLRKFYFYVRIDGRIVGDGGATPRQAWADAARFIDTQNTKQ